MLESRRYELRKWLASLRGRIPVYEVQEDGRIELTWENPADRESRAFDREGCKQQLFIKGYANPVDLSVEGDPSETEHLPDETEVEPAYSREEPTIRLMPSQRYEEYMSQNIVSQAIQGGGLDQHRLMWLSGGTLVSVLILLIVVVAMLT